MIVKQPKHQIMAAEELERTLQLKMEDYLSEFVIDVRNINQENNKYSVHIEKNFFYRRFRICRNNIRFN